MCNRVFRWEQKEGKNIVSFLFFIVLSQVPQEKKKEKSDMKRLRRGADDEGEGADGDDDGDDDELDIDQGDGGDDDDEGKSHRKAELSKDFFQIIENGADADADDGDRVDYEDLMMPAAMAQGGNDDHLHNPAGGPRSNSKKKAKTLLELAQGPNRDAATNMIEDSVYAMAIVCNFVSFR